MNWPSSWNGALPICSAKTAAASIYGSRHAPWNSREEPLDDALRQDIIAGAYWRTAPGPETKSVIAYTGAVAPEAEAAARQTGAALLAITSADRLHQEWTEKGSGSHIHQLLSAAAGSAKLASVLDGHPATLSWLGAVAGHGITPLGVQTFGQSADIPDLYRVHGIDADSIVAALT